MLRNTMGGREEGVPISITMVYVPTLSALLEGGGVKFLEKALRNT